MGRKKQSAQRGQVEELLSDAKFHDAVKGNHNEVSSFLINYLEWFWYINVIFSLLNTVIYIFRREFMGYSCRILLFI